MKTIKNAKVLGRTVDGFRKRGERIGFVPTMGALHEGHLSLVRKAARENDRVIVSIFVNPLQFGPREDFRKYPRRFEADTRLLRREPVDILFCPSVSEVYPAGRRQKYLNPGPFAKPLCGRKRPGHFRGVVTVVKRLFDMTRPDRAYFGRKDYQQFKVIEGMVSRHRMPVEVIGCPLVRDRDGVALSSRNRYLSGTGRRRARSLYRALCRARRMIKKGIREPEAVQQAMKEILATQVDKIDYVEVVDPATLKPVRQIKGPVLAAVACFVEGTRLIDNLLITR